MPCRLETGGQVMTAYRAFLSPELIEQIASGESGFRPLVGLERRATQDLGPLEAVDGLGQGIGTRVARAAHWRFDTDPGQ